MIISKINQIGLTSIRYFSMTPDWVMSLLARFVVASIFWKSAITKLALNTEGAVDSTITQVIDVITFNWTVADSTYMLFEYEYDLPVLSPQLAAHLSIAGELLFPIALFTGLFTRFAALGLLGMTAVIQFFVFPNLWTTHGLWTIALLFIISKGPGFISLDTLIKRKVATS